MDTPRKILILHASAGHGHEKAARAIEEACRSASPRMEVAVEDALTLTPGFFGNGYKKSYLFLIQKLPWLWGFFYYLFDNVFVYALARPFRRLLNCAVAQKIEDLVCRTRPTAVICTHFLSVEVVGALKKRHKTDASLIAVITDFKAHRFWLDECVDRYAVGSEATRDEMVARGVRPEKIEVTGVPVAGKFAAREGREKLRVDLGLRNDRFTVLVTSGGAGVGSIYSLVKALAEIRPEIQALVVCGQNEKILSRLNAEFRGLSTVRLFGFVNFMDRLMEASDVLVGKSGGLTVSESLCKGAPMIVFEPVPGQETANALYIRNEGAGVIARSPEEVACFVRQFSGDPEALARLRNSALKIAKPEAARRVAGFAEDGRR